ncbi:MAG: hypothetical protein C4333_10605 [Meiothermus sp.]
MTHQPDRRRALKMLGGLALGLAGGALAQQGSALKGLEATLYKSPTCGCCGEYVKFLQAQGALVKVVLQDDLSPLKRRYGIPPEAQSCHTMRLAGYTVEGHVPLAALQKLLRERPRVEGIALPGMPSGTPGMPGPRTQPYWVLALVKGRLEPFVTL